MTHEEQAKVAAKWWRDRLSETAKMDNGDQSEMGGMAFVLAMLTHPSLPSKDSLDKFEETLREATIAGLQNGGFFTLSCDYDPCIALSDAALVAEIEPRCPPFPWKTNMHFHENKVSVSHGYGAEYVDLED